MKNDFYLILVTLILVLSACEDKPQNNEKNVTKTEENIVIKKTSPQKTLPIEYHFEFKNLKNQVSILDIKNDVYNFKNIKQSIVIFNIMATWCPPCRGQIPHLTKLQQKFKKNVFVMSALVHDDISKEKLDKFTIAQKALYYLSTNQNENLKFVNMIIPKLRLSEDFPMPLTILFYKGKYFTHYEGMIPEEMIESDIKQLLKKIKE